MPRALLNKSASEIKGRAASSARPARAASDPIGIFDRDVLLPRQDHG